MHKHLSEKAIFYSIIVPVFFCFFSCVSVKQLTYFQDVPETNKLSAIKLPAYVEPVIHPTDVLAIVIYATDPSATANVNVLNAGSGNDGGYSVDNEGNIELSELGKIHVEDLTIAQVHDEIKKRAKLYFENPVVVIKNKSFKITILGEVNKPGVIYIPTEKPNIIDALGLSGDLTAFGNKENILLLRKNLDNTVSTIRINLKSSALMESPYFYLQNNDILYVGPSKAKAIASDVVFSRNLTLGTLGLTLFSTFYLLLKR